MNPIKNRKKLSPRSHCPALAALLLCLPAAALADKEHAQASQRVFTLSDMTIFNDADSSVLDEQPRLLNRLNRDSLQSTGMPDLNGVLRSQSGLMLNQSPPQTVTGMSMRGASGGQGLITLDGVPLFANFAGFYALNNYPLDALEQITVTRGPGGDRHGSRTQGGAIHLQTRHLDENDRFLRVEAGSYDTVRSTAGTGLSSRAGDFSFVAGHSNIFSGISQSQLGNERDPFDMTHASANWNKEFARGSLNGSIYFVNNNADIDGPGLVPSRRKIGWADDKLGKMSEETWVAQLKGQYNLASNWNSSLQLGFTQNRQHMISTLIRPMILTSQLLMLDWQNSHRLPLNTGKKDQALLAWGVNAQHQEAAPFPSAQTVVSPNVRGELALGDWQWSADARSDHGDVYGNHQVFSLGLTRFLPHNMSVWSNGGTGYRQPGVTELMHPVFGNKALQGEHSAGGEIGWGWRPRLDSEVKVSAYYQNYRQLITMQLNSRTGVSAAANVPEADAWGTEMQARHRWSKAWTSGANYSFIDIVNPINNLRVPARPQHQGVFWNEIQLAKPLKLRVELTVHSGYWADAANTLWLQAAPRVNTMLTYQVMPKTEIYLRGDNITDERATEIYDFNFNGAAFYLGMRTGF